MIRDCLPTHFAPAERASSEDVLRQGRALAETPLIAQFLDALPSVFLVLNQQRQIVLANRALLDFVGLEDENRLRGMRPGEALDCVHSWESESGCGTMEHCQTCGAVKTILASLRGVAEVDECRVTRRDGSSLDLRVWGKPFDWNGEMFSLFTLMDISHEKRRRALERIFFHDVMNTVGALSGFAELMGDSRTQEELALSREMIGQGVRRLVEEIQAQRQLLEAESGEMIICLSTLNSIDVLYEVKALYLGHEVAQDRRLEINPRACEVPFASDRRLLGRVLGNMVKNALEACEPGQTVTLNCAASSEHILFEVHNPNVMPRDVQLQMFQRSFSTKGPGRGLGMYSVKLLTERYLGGMVTFTSSLKLGTTFRAAYPLQPNARKEETFAEVG